MSVEFDLAMLLYEIEADVAGALPSDVTLNVRVAPATRGAHCCRDGLRDAVIQLLLNARDALPIGGAISLNAASGHHENLGPTIELQIADNGLGMPQEMLRRATEPFFTTKATGLGGLGLTIVSHFAEDAGGAFRLQSRLGLGTEATLSLPVRI